VFSPECLGSAIVPMLWFYEVGNGLLMANRRKRISLGQIDDFLRRLAALRIEVGQQTPSDLLKLPALARLYNLTSYDAAYLAIAIGSNFPIATTDSALRKAAAAANVQILSARLARRNLAIYLDSANFGRLFSYRSTGVCWRSSIWIFLPPGCSGPSPFHSHESLQRRALPPKMFCDSGD
jgi:predicted nucleic acid-binding protein